MKAPIEFDPRLYRRYKDLKSFSYAELHQHFVTFGLSEGRVASEIKGRADLVALVVNADTVLEIGPFCNPTVTGPNVRYFDVMDREALIARAKAIGTDPTNIPEIKYISPTGDLSIIKDTFDIAVSSHCIEHQPDLIKHLQEVEALLKPNGAYLLSIPDKRYCFDHFLLDASLQEIIAAHFEKRAVHSFRSVLEHRLLTCHNDPGRHWNNDHGDMPSITEQGIERVRAEWKDAAGAYIDVHAWQFTPTSFRHLIASLNAIGVTRLVVMGVYGTYRGSNEFYVILQRS